MAASDLLVGLNGRFFPKNWRPALVEIEFAQTHGFAAIQVQGTLEGLTAAQLGAPSFAPIQAALQAAGITPVMEMLIGLDLAGRASNGQTALDVLQANLPAITGLGCRCVHWHLTPREPFSEATAHALEVALRPQFGAAVALAASHGFEFGVEHNAPPLALLSAPARCAELLAAVPGLQLVWDLNHTLATDQPGFEAMIGRISMLHVSDTPLPAVNHHLPLGMGSVDLVARCAALRAANFSGPAILEIGGLPLSGGYGRDTDAALIDSRDRLAQAWKQAQERIEQMEQ